MKAHPWFASIVWDTLLDQPAQWVPEEESRTDTRNFASNDDYAAMAGIGGRDLADATMPADDAGATPAEGD